MKLKMVTFAVSFGLLDFGSGLGFSPTEARAQSWLGTPSTMVPAPTTSMAQRNALSNVRARARWLQNATRTASNFRTGAAEMLWQQFQFLRASYNGFLTTLNLQQANNGANQWAELNAGLDIIQQAFSNFQDDLAQGRLPSMALNDLSQVLQDASSIWLQELNQVSSQLRVGR
jgi:hypothetical protein